MTLHIFFLSAATVPLTCTVALHARAIPRIARAKHARCASLHESAYKELHTFTFTQWKGMQFPRITRSAAIHASDTVDIAVNECLDLSTSHTVM